MQNRNMKLVISTGILMLPMMAAWANAPIVQGHPTQSAGNNTASTTVAAEPPPSTVPTTVSAPSVSTEPVNASATTQAPNQALVTSDAGTSVNANNPLDISNQISMLQQQVQDLRGQVEVQGHVIAQLQAQITQLSGGKVAPTVVATSAATPDQPTSMPQSVVSNSSASTTTVVSNNKTSSGQPAPNNTATKSSADNQSELQLYQQAYSLMAAKQYSQATVALQTYLQQYPTGQYAANSHYWLGELALISGNTTQAQNQFNIVINQFNQSPKTADSMLKLGMIFYGQQQWQQAKVQFNNVIKQYPDTTSAQLAQQQLRQIQQGGN